MEVRLCAERPREDYRPTPGTATHVRWPEGPGLRTDRAIESGSVVSPAYDSLVAKLMAHGAGPGLRGRPTGAGRCGGLELDGLETNRHAARPRCSTTPSSGEGEADVHYLDGRPDLRDAALPDEARHRHAAAAGSLPDRERGRPEPCPGSRRRVAQRRPGAPRRSR